MGVWKIFLTFSLFVATLNAHATDLPAAWHLDFADFQKSHITHAREEPRHRIILNEDALAFEEMMLPVDGRPLISRRKSFIERGPSDKVWYGHVGSSDFLSVITSYNGRVEGKIWSDDGLYEISSTRLGNYLHRPEPALAVVGKDVALPSLEFLWDGEIAPIVPIYSRRRAVSPGDSNCTRGLYPLYTVDVLFLYDETTFECGNPDFPEECLDLDTLIARFKHWVDVQNAVLVNSRIYHGRYKFVGAEKRGYTTALDLYGDSARTIEDPWLAEMRKKYSADDVMLVVGGRPSSVIGLNHGWFTITFTKAGWRVASHEWGHGLGQNHQRELYENPDGFVRQYAFAHYVDFVFRTVMNAHDPNRMCYGCDDVPVYSNPHLLYKGVPLGVAEEKDNARRGREEIRAESEESLGGTPPQCVSLQVLQTP